MLATSKRLRSSSPPSSPLDQVTKRRRHTSSQQGSSSQQGPASLHEEDETDGNNGGWQQPQWVAAGPSGWRGDVPPVTQAHRPRQQAGSPWEVAADTTFYSPTGRPPAPSSYFHPNRPGQQAVPSPLGPAVQSPSYFPPFPPASAALLQQATAPGGGPSIHTPRATAGAQHDSHAHHRNAPLFHPAFVDQHPPWSSSSSASSVAAIGVHSRPPDGMGPSGAFDGGPRSQHEAITPLMGPPTLPVPADGRDDSRRASFGRPMRGGSMEADEPDDDDDDEDAEDSWDATAGTVQGNLDSLADSPYAGMNQLLHSLHRPRQPQPDVASSPFPHFARPPLQHGRQAYQHAQPSPHTPLEDGPGRLNLHVQESSATRHRYGEVNRQLGELVLNRRAGRGVGDGEVG